MPTHRREHAIIRDQGITPWEVDGVLAVDSEIESSSFQFTDDAPPAGKAFYRLDVVE